MEPWQQCAEADDFESFMDTLMREAPDNPDGASLHIGTLSENEHHRVPNIDFAASSNLDPVVTLPPYSRQQQHQNASTSQPTQPPDHQASRPPRARKPPSAASLSQKKYMQRQKQKMHDTDIQVEKLTQQLADLQKEKADLEAKERVMQYNLQGIQMHAEHLFAHKTIRDSIQLNLLEKKAQVQALVEGHPITLEEVRGWSMHHYITVRFQTFIAHLGRLVSRVKQDPSSTAAAELELLVSKHGSYNMPGGLSSCWHWALLSWNLEETKRTSQPPPDAATLLAELQLSEEQQQALLHFRRKLLRELEGICEKRQKIFAKLGLEVLASSKEEMHKCPAAVDLHASLKGEQTAVLAFILDTDEVLSALQEATLNLKCYPWCPEMLQLCDTLAQIRGEPVASPLDVGACAQIPLMPFASAYQMLTMRVTAMGCSKHLRRGYVMCPTWPVLSRFCCPHGRQEHLGKMSLLAVCSGRWRRCTSYQWLQQVRQTGRLEPNVAVENPADLVD